MIAYSVLTQHRNIISPPGLVRATAINASRAKRSMLNYYQHYYEERSRALESIISNHREPATFEDFVTRVYSPKPLTNIFSSSAAAAGGPGSSRPSSLIASTSLGSQALSSALGSNGGSATSPFAASTAAEQFHMRGRSKTDVGQHVDAGNDEGNNGGLASPRQSRRKVVVPAGNSAKVVSNRPLSIKEEPGLPGQHTNASANPVTRRR